MTGFGKTTALSLATLFTGLAAAPAVAQDMPVDINDAVMAELTPTQVMVQALSDQSSLGDKLQRLENDRDYYKNLTALADEAREENWFDAPSTQTFLAILHTVMNPQDVNANVLLGFDGTEQDARNSATLDDNIGDLIAAARNPDNTAISDPLLRFKAVAGEVRHTAFDDAMDYYASYAFDASNIHLDPTPREKKLARYETDENYAEAWRTAANGTYNEERNGSMYYTSYAHLWDAYFNPEMTWDLLSQVPDNDNDDQPTEFRKWTAGDGLQRDNNIDALLRARDEILPDTPPLQLDKRAALFQEIDDATIRNIEDFKKGKKAGIATDGDYPFSADNVFLDLSPLPEKQARYERDGSYQEAAREFGKKFAASPDFANMYYTSLITFWSAALDKNITWDMIKNTPDEDDDNDTPNEFFWNRVSDNNLDNNMQFIFEARDEILPDVMPENLEERRVLFDQVIERAREKIAVQYAPWDEYYKALQNDPAYAGTQSKQEFSFDAYYLLKRAHTDPSVTAADLTAAGLTARDESSNSLAHNFNMVLEARDASAVPSYESVHTAAGEKLQAQYNDHTKTRFMLWGGLAGLLLLGGAGAGGAVGYNRYRRKNPKPKPH
ncbi:MAG: hypothetical protein HND56_02120 [Pseudomonadota bacterium]|nr:hypothetical protein [Pseudomonadota bacterium]QKK04557.1 MAG: hypothetical protein HND56_02120 [Pseudomonadota bacterium]